MFDFSDPEKCIIRSLNMKIANGEDITDIFPWEIDGFPDVIQMEILLIGAKYLKLNDRRQSYCKKQLEERFFIQC